MFSADDEKTTGTIYMKLAFEIKSIHDSNAFAGLYIVTT
jgi:hypothetical protein